MPKARPFSPSQAAQAIRQAAALHQQGLLDRAEAIYRDVLKVAPDNFDALHLLGVLRQQQGRSAEALKLIAAALKRNSASADALSNYGVVLDALRRHEEAVAAFDKALALKPDKADALNNRGNALNKAGRREEALASFQAALALVPHDLDALVNKADALLALGRHAEALAAYDRALALKHDHLGALARRGNALFALERYPEALASYDAALAIDPRLPGALNNRGYALLALGRIEEALASYEAALALKPDHLEALINSGNALAALDRHDAADRRFETALAIAPDCAEAKWNRSLLYLSRGKFAEGWPLYEQRWGGGVKGAAPRHYPQPRWDGGRVNGTLLVWGEQGLGDQILHASMVPELVGHADSVVLEVEPRLAALFGRSFPGVQIATLRPELFAGRVDAHAPLGSLGAHLRPAWEAFPARRGGYLVADADRTAKLRERLTHGKRRVIGLSWRSVAPLIGRCKSARLADFEPLLRLPDCRFVDLQYGDTLAERTSVEREFGVRVERLGDIDNTHDIDGLAALMEACDVVATVSNTTAHLAGALGRPTVVFVPFGNARIWYWFKDRADSPWYPRVRLRRQQNGQSWGNLISAAAQEISCFNSTA